MNLLCFLLAALQTPGAHPLYRRLRAEHLHHMLYYHVSMLWISAWLAFYTVGCGWLRLLLAWRARWAYWRFMIEDTRIGLRLAWRRRLDARLLLLAAALWPLVWWLLTA